jgi:putative FmdB family regulatory protein
MPIYAYKCTSCGFAQDEMLKISDAPLSVCPACGKADYAKQITAAGFALKGSGWYATDFKGSGSKPVETKPAEAKPEAPSPACGTGACPACN